MRIFDCLPFFRESRLLYLRMRLLWNFVDYFCIVEAGETHTGQKKESNFHGFIKDYPEFASKIRYKFVERFPAGSSDWGRENYQRLCLDELIADADSDDWILTSDADEIPDPGSLFTLRSGAVASSFLHFRQYHCYFRFNYVQVAHRPISKDPFWYGTVAHRRKLRVNSQLAREMRWPGLASGFSAGVVSPGGWHFSYLGDDNDFQIKLRSIAEHDLPFVALARAYEVRKLIEQRLCPFFPNDNVWAVLDQRSLFPQPILNILSEWPEMLLPGADTPQKIIERIRAFHLNIK